MLNISDEAWMDLYRRLLMNLSERGYTDLANEIENAAKEPIVEEFEASNVADSRGDKSDLGKNVSRAARPYEAFGLALSVLETRLREIPVAAAKTAQRLKRDPAAIRFQVDFGEQYLVSEESAFSLGDAVVDSDQEAELASLLARIREHIGPKVIAT